MKYAPCPVRGCKAWIGTDARTLCIGHWEQLPYATRRQLDILRARQRRSPRHRELYALAVRNAARLACPQRYARRAVNVQLALWG